MRLNPTVTALNDARVVLAWMPTPKCGAFLGVPGKSSDISIEQNASAEAEICREC